MVNPVGSDASGTSQVSLFSWRRGMFKYINPFITARLILEDIRGYYYITSTLQGPQLPVEGSSMSLGKGVGVGGEWSGCRGGGRVEWVERVEYM